MSFLFSLIVGEVIQWLLLSVLFIRLFSYCTTLEQYYFIFTVIHGGIGLHNYPALAR
jgi:hypothetical protein